MSTTPIKSVQGFFSILLFYPRFWENQEAVKTSLQIESVDLECSSEYTFYKDTNSSYLSLSFFLGSSQNRKPRLGHVEIEFDGDKNIMNLYASFAETRIYLSSNGNGELLDTEQDSLLTNIAINTLILEIQKSLMHYKKELTAKIRNVHDVQLSAAKAKEEEHKAKLVEENHKLLDAYRVVTSEEADILLGKLHAGEEIELQVIKNRSKLKLDQLTIQKKDGVYVKKGNRVITQEQAENYIRKARIAVDIQISL